MRRNLCDDCKDCEDNDKSMSYCFAVCGVPIDILNVIEKERNATKSDILDKIRAEIEEYSLLTRERVIGIIDKYKAESEDK